MPPSQPFKDGRGYTSPSAKPHTPTFRTPRQVASHRFQAEGAQEAPPPKPADPFNLSLDESITATPAAAPVQAPVPPQQPQPVQSANAYDFMTQPAPAARSLPRLSLPGTNSLPLRIAYIVGGLLVLVIVFSIVKGLVIHGPDLTSLVGVAQDQQELLHLVGETTPQAQSMSTASLNLTATAQLAVTSSQSALLKYLALNGQKITAKTLSLKVSTAIDNQLSAAAAATTYDQTFQQVMQSQLHAYMNDLSQAYTKAPGQHGRALLSSDYNQAKLLLTQLNQPAQ